MKINIVDHNNKSIKNMTVNEPSVGSSSLINQALQFENNNKRQPIAHTKDRGDVRGGGIKPWRQKGTGRARAGSSRSPIWRGGGVTFGPLRTNNFSERLPKKMRNLALQSLLAKHIENSSLYVIDSINISQPKTKDGANLLSSLGLVGTTLIVLDEMSHHVLLSFRNLSHVKITTVASLRLLDLNAFSVILLNEAAAKQLFGAIVAKSAVKNVANIDNESALTLEKQTALKKDK